LIKTKKRAMTNLLLLRINIFPRMKLERLFMWSTMMTNKKINRLSKKSILCLKRI